MGHAYTNLTYHIVFGTKNRRPSITPDTRPRLCEYLGGTVRGLGGSALAVNCVQDHVHILARLRQDRAICDVIRDIKANSSKWLRGRVGYGRSFAWQTGYGAFTVSRSQIRRATTYIAGQEAHHRKTTFEDEFLALLKAHGIEFDPRYLWD
jgi:putative transposase